MHYTWQSGFERHAGYEDVKDAERLRHDALRWIVGGKAAKGRAVLAATSVKRPLWLGLYITDELAVPSVSVDALSGARLNFSSLKGSLSADKRGVFLYSVGTQQ
jgi:hypothetical protein